MQTSGPNALLLERDTLAAKVQTLEQNCRDNELRLIELEERNATEISRAIEAERKAAERLESAQLEADATKKEVAALQSECNVLTAKLKVLESPQSNMEEEEQTNEEEEEEQPEDGASAKQKQKRPLGVNKKRTMFRALVKNFVTDHLVSADQKTHISTRQIKSAFKGQGYAIESAKLLERTLAKEIHNIHSSAKKKKTNTLQGYSGLKLKND